MAINQSTPQDYYDQALRFLVSNHKRFWLRAILALAATAVIWCACIALFIPKDFKITFPGNAIPFSAILAALIMFMAYTLIGAYVPKLRTYRYTGRFHRVMIYAGMCVSGLFGIPIWILYAPLPALQKLPIVMSLTILALFLLLIPLLVMVLFSATDAYFNKDQLIALNGAHITKNIQTFKGQPIYMDFPEVEGFSPQEFKEKLDALCRFYASKQIIHSWRIEDEYAAIFPFFDAKIRLMTLSQGYAELKPSRSAIIITRQGSISFHANPSDAKTFSKFSLRPPVFYDMLKLLKNSALNFWAGNSGDAVRWLIGKDTPGKYIHTNMGKFIIVYLVILMLVMPVMLFSLFKLNDSCCAEPTTKSITDFLVASGGKNGTLWRDGNCTDCGSALMNASTAVAALSYFGRLDEIDAQAAADFIAGHQVESGLLVSGGNRDTDLPDTAAAVQALELLGYTNKINAGALTQTLLDTRSGNGLFSPPDQIKMDEYEYSYYALKILHALGAMDARDARGAWKRFTAATASPPHHLEWYLFDLSQTFGYDIADHREWIVRRFKDHSKDFLVKKSERASLNKDRLSTPWQAASVFTEFQVRPDNAIMDLEYENKKRMRMENGKPLFIKSYPSIYPYIIAYDRIQKAMDRNPMPKLWHKKYLTALFALLACSLLIPASMILLDVADRRNEHLVNFS